MISIQVHFFCTNDEDRNRLAKVLNTIEPNAVLVDGNTGEPLDFSGPSYTYMCEDCGAEVDTRTAEAI